MNDEEKRLIILRDKLAAGLLGKIHRIFLNGHPQKRLPNNVNLTVDSIAGESMILNLDLEGICASAGSACSSGRIEKSHVLTAMGLQPEQVQNSIRFTLGMWTTEEEIERIKTGEPVRGVSGEKRRFFSIVAQSAPLTKEYQNKLDIYAMGRVIFDMEKGRDTYKDMVCHVREIC